jgi:hypothetical protein
LKKFGLKAKEQVTLVPYERYHAVVTGIFKPTGNALITENNKK